MKMEQNEKPEKQRKKDKRDYVTKYGHLRSIYDKYSAKAEKNPRRFLWKMYFLGIIGSPYLIMFLLLFLATILLSLIIPGFDEYSNDIYYVFLIPGSFVLYIIFRRVFIKTAYPETIIITRDDYPKLTSIINESAGVYRKISLKSAYVLPAFGSGYYYNFGKVAGFEKGQLFLGIDSIRLLDDNELKAFIIKELFHYKSKERWCNFLLNKNIYQWSKVSEFVKGRGVLARSVLGMYARACMINMQIHLDVISKYWEFQADKKAVESIDKETYGSALTKMEFFSQFFKDVPSELNHKILSMDNPPENFFDQIFETFYKDVSNKGGEWLNQIKKSISEKYGISHSYIERMNALNIEPCLPVFDRSQSRDLQEETKKLLTISNVYWHEYMKDEWLDFTQSYKETYKETKELIEDFQLTDNPDKLLDYGIALEGMKRFRDADEIYDKILSVDSKNSAAVFRKGMIMLNTKNLEGIDYIMKAAESDGEFIPYALEAIESFLLENGLHDKRNAIAKWTEEKQDYYEKKLDECENVYLTDEYQEKDLNNNLLLEIKRIIDSYPDIDRVFLVRKVLHYTDHKLHIFGVSFRSYRSKRKMQQIIDDFARQLTRLDFSSLIINLSIDCQFESCFENIQGANIYNKCKQGDDFV